MGLDRIKSMWRRPPKDDVQAWVRPQRDTPRPTIDRASRPRFFTHFADGIEPSGAPAERPTPVAPVPRRAPVHPSNLPPALDAPPFGADPARAAAPPPPSSVVPVRLEGPFTATLELELPSGTLRLPPLNDREVMALVGTLQKAIRALTGTERVGIDIDPTLGVGLSRPFTFELTDGLRVSLPAFTHVQLCILEGELQTEWRRLRE
jgi:hypothetical protein